MILLLVLVSSCVCEPPLPPNDHVVASDAVKRTTGIAAYDFTLVADAPLTVLLSDETGQSRGTLRMGPGTKGGFEHQLTTPDGRKAMLRSHLTSEVGGFWMRQRLEAEGEVLLIELFASDDHELLRLILAVPGDAPPEAPSRPDGFNDVFLAYEGGSLADETALQAWLEERPLHALRASPATQALFLILNDPPLFERMADRVRQMTAASASHPLLQSIHGSAACGSLINAYSVPLGLFCGACVAGGAVPSAPACVACLATPVAMSIHGLKCVASSRTARTLQSCQAECKPEEEASVDGETDQCVCTCKNDLCRMRAESIVRAPATICSTGCDQFRQCKIYIQKCGNGRVESGHGCTEICDPNAQPTGCKPDEVCTGCSQCKKRETDAGTEPEPDGGTDPADAGTDDAGTDDAGTEEHCNPPCEEGTVCVNCREYVCLPAGAQCCDLRGTYCEPGWMCGVCPDGQTTCVSPDGYDLCTRDGDF